MIPYAIATAEMDELMSRLHRLFDIRITFFDMQEHELEYFHVKPMSPFCAALRRSKKRDDMCTACDKDHLAEAKQQRDVIIYHCHAGLIEGVVPLYDRRNVYLGAIVFGQLRDRSRRPSPEWPDALTCKYRALPVYTVERARDIGLLLKSVSESIIDHELIRYRNKPWVEKLDNTIEQHLGEKLTIPLLAEAIGRSASFVAHHFAAEFGHSPRQYILKRRMEEARTMLENGTTVQDAAERLGFYDAFHFSRTFKRFWGKPPCTYRQQA
jgi:AraC-like DNA-binding protein